MQSNCACSKTFEFRFFYDWEDAYLGRESKNRNSQKLLRHKKESR